jgi:hypothetical protein
LPCSKEELLTAPFLKKPSTKRWAFFVFWRIIQAGGEMTKKEYHAICELNAILNGCGAILFIAHKNGDIDLDLATEGFPKGLRFVFNDINKAYGIVQNLLIDYDKKNPDHWIDDHI